MSRQKVVKEDGTIVFCEGGILAPGWKAAIAMLDLERKLATDEAKHQQTDGEKVDIVALSDRIRACEVAVALLKVQGRRLGLDV